MDAPLKALDEPKLQVEVTGPREKQTPYRHWTPSVTRVLLEGEKPSTSASMRSHILSRGL